MALLLELSTGKDGNEPDALLGCSALSVLTDIITKASAADVEVIIPFSCEVTVTVCVLRNYYEFCSVLIVICRCYHVNGNVFIIITMLYTRHSLPIKPPPQA